MREKRYDILLWDVDGTLLNFLKSERWALTEAFLSYGIEIDDEVIAVYSAINDSFWKRLELGEVTKEQVLKGRFEKLFEEFLPQGRLAEKRMDAEHLSKIEIAEFQHKYQRNLGSVYFYLEDSLSLCKKLKEEGFLQYIITNGVEWTQRNKLHLAGFDSVMEDIYISEVIGYNKPDVKFFDRCLLRIQEGIDRRRVLVIGDSMTSDMKGAENAGLDSCLYAPGSFPSEKPDSVTYQIASLWDVEELIWQNQKDRN
ncbi:MAG: HAD-IA family hydrolase [Lachnospiraceae bacterium]|nr:HAD-IA family hydrolase [Lachnospiraceae bacterium]